MDKGSFIMRGYTVEPGEDGSFIVVQGGAKFRNDGLLSAMHGFSNYRDMLLWLQEEHVVFSSDYRGGGKGPGTLGRPIDGQEHAIEETAETQATTST
jgi:hypothetical protein